MALLDFPNSYQHLVLNWCQISITTWYQYNSKT